MFFMLFLILLLFLMGLFFLSPFNCNLNKFLIFSLLFFMFCFIIIEAFGFMDFSSLLPSGQVLLNFQDLNASFQPSLKPSYATPQQMEAYNKLVQDVNSNYQWMSCNGLFFEYPKFMEIPKYTLIPHEEYESMWDSLNAVFLSQLSIITAFLSFFVWGVITLMVWSL